LICGCQELERRAHDKYDAFDRVNAEVHQLRERCSAFDALADALRTPDGWLAYWAMAWRDELPESSGQDPARRSSLERVCASLIDRDEALWQARSDLEKTRTLAANWEAEVANVRGKNRELRSSLEGAQAQQHQAEERAKEANDLKAALDAKVAALAIAEERLLQERSALQGAEGRLQQEQAALVDARTALEQERVAREAAQKSLAERDDKLSKAEGELVMLGITNANQELVLQEQGKTVKRLELTVEAVRCDFEMERKQVEGELLLDFLFGWFFARGLTSSFLISFLSWWF
jgi:DNA repair exonuclease SbcCD ATPase subunit